MLHFCSSYFGSQKQFFLERKICWRITVHSFSIFKSIFRKPTLVSFVPKNSRRSFMHITFASKKKVWRSIENLSARNSIISNSQNIQSKMKCTYIRIWKGHRAHKHQTHKKNLETTPITHNTTFEINSRFTL